MSRREGESPLGAAIFLAMCALCAAAIHMTTGAEAAAELEAQKARRARLEESIRGNRREATRQRLLAREVLRDPQTLERALRRTGQARDGEIRVVAEPSTRR